MAMDDDKEDDLFSALEARDEALDRVSTNSGDWWVKAINAVQALPSGFEGAAEDIRLVLQRDGLNPHHHNAWGAMIKRCIALKLLKPTGKRRPMKTRKSHGRPTDVYRR